MRTSAMFLLLLGIALVSGEETSEKVNQLETRNVPQVAKPNQLDTASTRNGEMQIAHMQYSPNRMDSQEMKYQQMTQQLQNTQSNIQSQTPQFYSQNQISQIRQQDMNQMRQQDMNQMRQQEINQMRQQEINQMRQQEINQHQMRQQEMNQMRQQDINQMRQQDINQILQAQNQALYNQAEAQLRQLRNNEQLRQLQQTQMQQTQMTTQPQRQEQTRQDQEITNILQSQERMTPTPVSTVTPTTQTPTTQAQNLVSQQIQQLYSSDVPSETPMQFYQERRTVADTQDTTSERRFDDSSSRQQQNQVVSGVQSTAVRTGGFSQVFPQRSAFDNRQQPIVLPGVSQTHSTSVVVSGLKNLPVLPALVYSAAPVPSSHAVAYSRPWFQGGAYIKQHFQTPYARYVYSHIL